MTKHPLTNKKCEALFTLRLKNTSQPVTVGDSMRFAADWQLEQVIEWLNETIFERGSSLEAVNIPEDLKQAMRPTTTQEDN